MPISYESPTIFVWEKKNVFLILGRIWCWAAWLYSAQNADLSECKESERWNG